MEVESVSEEISTSSQIWMWTPDGGREPGDLMGCCCDDDDDGKKEKSSAAMAMPTSGNGADGLGVDGKTGRERRGGRRRF